ncbi:hypothetical protein D3C86_1246040 [compost metagenome]
MGTTSVLVTLGLALMRSPWWLLFSPLVGYGFAWVGHFAFEKNKPATFTYPLWSLRADFRLYRYMVTGRMDKELERLGLENLPKEHR